jgi:hypothetical protein
MTTKRQEKNVKRADRPDSVQLVLLAQLKAVTAIPLGRASLHGSVLPTRQLCGATSTLAYLVLLRVEIARFTQDKFPVLTRLCCSNPHLTMDSR